MFRSLSRSILYQFTIRFNSSVIKQRRNPNTVPVIIINFNQLSNLRKLVDFLLKRKIENIIIIDNKSDYPPLLAYYETLQPRVKVELMNQNFGHMVFFENEDLQRKYGQGYYIVTDADILPNPSLPIDFIKIMIDKMDKYNRKIVKVGFALDLNTIPEHYPLKGKVISWEKKFWEEELEDGVFLADVDTTFALYKPFYPTKFKVRQRNFYRAIRLGGNFTSKHMGWYLDPKALTPEQVHYNRTSSSSNSWKFDEEGNLDSPSAY